MPTYADRFWREAVAYLHQLILFNFSPDVLIISDDELSDGLTDDNKLALFQTLKLAWGKCLTPDLRKLVLQQVIKLASKYPRDQVFDVFATSFSTAATDHVEPVADIKEMFFEEEIPYPENPHSLPMAGQYKAIAKELDEFKGKKYKALRPFIDEVRQVLDDARNYTFVNCDEKAPQEMPVEHFNMKAIGYLVRCRAIKAKIQNACLGRLWASKKEVHRAKLIDTYNRIEQYLIAPQIVAIGEITYSDSLLLPRAV